MNASRLAFLLLLGCYLTACRHPLPAAKGHLVPTMSPLETVTISIDPRRPWNATGYPLVEGRRYVFSTEALPDRMGRGYSDKGLKCSPEGPQGWAGWWFDWIARDARCPLNPVHWFGPGRVKRLRVLRDRFGSRASFLTVIGAIDRDDRSENTFVIGNRAELTAFRSGELVVFSNDWPGGPDAEGPGRLEPSASYANNTGQIRLTVYSRP